MQARRTVLALIASAMVAVSLATSPSHDDYDDVQLFEPSARPLAVNYYEDDAEEDAVENRFPEKDERPAEFLDLNHQQLKEELARRLAEWVIAEMEQVGQGSFKLVSMTRVRRWAVKVGNRYDVAFTAINSAGKLCVVNAKLDTNSSVDRTSPLHPPTATVDCRRPKTPN